MSRMMNTKKILKQLIILIFGNQLINTTLFKTLYLARFATWCKQYPVGVDDMRKAMHSRVIA